MNERIEELARQATIRGEEYLPGNDGHPTPTFYFDKEKFAELIVQDINNTILHTARWHQEVDKDDNTVMALCDLVKDIREEYGVEG
jgi:hypothetical protein